MKPKSRPGIAHLIAFGIVILIILILLYMFGII